MYLTEKFAEFAVHTRYEDIPEQARRKAKQCILDTLGVMLAGSVESASRPVKEYVEEMGGRAQSTVIGLGIKTTAPLAAFANGLVGFVFRNEYY